MVPEVRQHAGSGSIVAAHFKNTQVNHCIVAAHFKHTQANHCIVEADLIFRHLCRTQTAHTEAAHFAKFKFKQDECALCSAHKSTSNTNSIVYVRSLKM